MSSESRKRFADDSGSAVQGPPIKRQNSPLFPLKQRFMELSDVKQKWIRQQKSASLLVKPYRIDEMILQPQFTQLFSDVTKAQSPQDQHKDQLELIRNVIQESVIIEWPKHIPGLTDNGIVDDDCSLLVDHAPLIHRARNVVKCRTPHPTMMIKVCAIGKPGDEVSDKQPKIVEALFKATLVKLGSESSEQKVTAGKLILTQREGTAATKAHEHSGAIVTNDGKLVNHMSAPDYHDYHLLERSYESKTTPLKYENGVLCATFPEMGVQLNSMVDRRQLSTRYAIQVEVLVNIDNKMVVEQTVYSHPFLIAITNDQTEPLLTSIFWQRLVENDAQDTSLQVVRWSVIKDVIRNFIKAQFSQARSLDDEEILHVQCMLFLPLAIKSGNAKELEKEWYGEAQINHGLEGITKLQNRLLSEFINDDVLISKKQFMQDKCFSVIDMQTELRHSVWQWLYRATEMVMDVGHKICPSPAAIEKKGSKTKKQMAAAEDYQTMLSLFNNRHITMLSMDAVETVFRSREKQTDEVQKIILLRFCEDNAGFLSFAYTNIENSQSGRPLFGSISCDQIKDFKQGLPEVLMDEPFPKNFDRLGKFEQLMCAVDVVPTFSCPKKRTIFHNYRTLRLQNDGVISQDRWKTRVNPLTGERLTIREKSFTPPSYMSGALDSLPPLSEQLKEIIAVSHDSTPGKSEDNDDDPFEELPISIPNITADTADNNSQNNLLAVMAAFLAQQGGLPLGNLAAQLTQTSDHGEGIKVETGKFPMNLSKKKERSPVSNNE
ncbi:hypothetical protein QR680_000194 [Steinernema hermaphroditum]|uniref:Uncharacterized protein n=1 Tax=Steinernema hermaphroditum TaxID=289476 RepID=A0AA39GUI2_9BILA|nr:hypothetical protein QR680_000194 [Steinernema hermaphroditum]